VNNLRIILDKLCVAIEELCKHGPLKPEESRGLAPEMVMDKKYSLKKHKS
jgi:hypothetical protein